jgi:hypothetical protein
LKGKRGVSKQIVNTSTYPSVYDFIHNFLAPKIKNYIGRDMIQGSTMHLKLEKGAINKSAYVSGIWHHDRCAKRIKCVTFITDTDIDSHPMRLIQNTHKQIYFDYSRFQTSRFTDNYAKKHGKEIIFTGRAGHGFCFDTNAIHKGTLEGLKERQTLVTEFHSGAIKNMYTKLHIHAPFGV